MKNTIEDRKLTQKEMNLLGDMPGYRKVKIYKIRINHGVYGGMWYGKKGGHDFWAALVVSEGKSKPSPVFKLVDHDGQEELSWPIMHLHINPIDCKIIIEKVFRINNERTFAYD